MNQIINQLIQLQELNFTLEEQKTLTTSNYLKELEKSIETLKKDLPEDIRSLYNSLINHYPIAVVPMAKGICTGCGISVPTIMAYEVKLGQKVMQCPRCTRIIYFSDSMPRQLKRITPFKSAPVTGISRFSSSRLMIPGLKAETRDDAIQEMINMMSDEGFVENPQSLFQSAVSREITVPTAMENGLAFPHVRGVEGGGLIFSAGTKEKGLHFGAPKKRLTKIVFFIVIPLAASAFYLQLIAGLMEAFREPESRKKLLACKTEEKMWDILTKTTKKYIK